MNINTLNKRNFVFSIKTWTKTFLLFACLFLSNSNINGQCNQNYDWAVWSNFTGNNAIGTINYNGVPISVNMSANYAFNSTPSIFNYPKFNGFSSVVPNTTVPRTEWTAGVGGVTTMCFSQTVTNPVLLLASLGNPSTAVTLTFSKNYVVVYDGGAMTYVDDTTITGQEGFAIIMFPGNFDCVSVYSSTPEYYTNITWGLNPPLFSVGVTGNTPSCDSVTLTASGGATYQWNGGLTPNSATNTFLSSGTYFLTVTDTMNCTVTTSETVTILPPNLTILLDTICQGDSIIVAGISHTVSGTYTYNLQNYEGCDSTVILDLVIGIPQSTVLTETICQGQSFSAGGVSHTMSGTYTYGLQTYQGCDSIVTLNLTVNPTQSTVLTETICQGQSFSAGGVSHTMSGTYIYSLQTYQGCDSTVTLNLTVNPIQSTILTEEICQGQTFEAGGVSHSITGTYNYNLQTYQGCDSTITLNLTVNPNYVTTLTETICQGQTYMSGGVSHTMSGTYTYNLQTFKGCDSTVVLNLTVNPIQSTVLTETICQGQSFTTGGVSHTMSGIYIYNLQTYQGCDSTVTLNLTVNPTPSVLLIENICQGQSFMAGGINHTTSGTYIYNLQTYQGCDSVVTLNLTVNSLQSTVLTENICTGQVFEVGGINHAVSGTYTYVLQTYQGCDSTVTLNLVVDPILTMSISEVICDGEIFEGYTETGIYFDTLTLNNGCLIIRTLDLTVLESPSFTESITICEGTTYNGYSETGIYADTVTTANGCDSIYTLYLDVIMDYFSADTVQICENEVYEFRGQLLSEAGFYTDHVSSPMGCDSSFSVYIEIRDEAFLGIDTMLCMAEGFRLYAPNENTIWYDNTISSSNKVTETGMYWATTIDDLGCEITDSIYIEFNFNSFIPNGFTPNNDGNNDCFFPNFSDSPFFISYKMSVMDRWGNLVFSTDNPNDCWNGEFRSQKCQSGVYVYWIELQTDSCPRTILKGDITLIR